MSELKWIANPGKREKPKDPTKMVWLMFRHENRVSTAPRKAGDFNWKHRDQPFDIMFAAEA